MAQNAKSTTSVDLANRSRSLTEENFGLNGIDPKSQYIYVMDTFDFYNYAARHGKVFDTIVSIHQVLQEIRRKHSQYKRIMMI